MRLCVFCGSSRGNRAEYSQAARNLGKIIATNGFELVYGGSNVGLMGLLANSVLEAGGKAIGVIPEKLQEQEIAHPNLSQLYIVETMHDRKAKMAELSDAFIALPGGAGTLEELFEVWTWGQLGFHDKPCGFLNVAGYYDTLLEFIDRMVAEGFLRAEYSSMLCVAEDLPILLDKLTQYIPPKEKWIATSSENTAIDS